MDLLPLFLQHPSANKDTRSTKAGDLYFALKGGNFDGNAFAQDALDKGAAYAIIDDPAVHRPSDARYILVPDALVALQELATAYRRTFDIPVIGITGSNGKTTTKELLAEVLKTQYRVHATAGNLNNHIGVPLTLLSMPADIEVAIVEMGANKPGDIDELVSIAEPTHGLITNVGKAHLEQLGGLEGVRQAKAGLFRFVRAHEGTVFVNLADANVAGEATGIARHTYGTSDASTYFRVLSTDVSQMTLEISHATWPAPEVFVSHISGEHNSLNIVAAVSVGIAFGISVPHLQAAIAGYIPTNNRSQLTAYRGLKLWKDAYNANPSSMRAAIAGVFHMVPSTEKVVLVLGDMFELGEHSEAEHVALGQYINEFSPICVVGVGEGMKAAIDMVQAPKRWYPDALAAKADFGIFTKGAGLVLLKGSRGIALEQMLEG